MLININDCKGLDMKLCQFAEEEHLTDEQFVYFTKGWQALWGMILNLPSADRPQGEWIGAQIRHYPGYECSLCHYGVQPWNNTNYCPNCGAKMRTK